MKRVLIVDDLHSSIGEMLLAAGYEMDYKPEIDRKGILEIIGQYEGLIIRSKTNVDKELIDKATKLEFIGRAGAGLDKIDYPYLSGKNIPLFNAPEGNRDAVGEHTIGMLLSLLHKINSASKQVKRYIWKREENRGWELKGRTVGIYGFGFMGSSLATKLSGFGCRVIAYDKYKSGFTNQFAEEVKLETFMKETEVLSIHIPLTSETKGIFNETYLAQFPNLKVILNTARGEVLKNKALIALLESGKLIGAGLDVLENEKINKLTEEEKSDFEKLASFSNVIFTPHVAGWTFESYQRINEVIVSKLQSAGLAHAH